MTVTANVVQLGGTGKYCFPGLPPRAVLVLMEPIY
jgi:hypothetical protein